MYRQARIWILITILGLSIVLTPYDVRRGASQEMAYPVTVTLLELLDVKGVRIQQVEVGQQVVIRTTFYNNADSKQPFLLVTDIHDAGGAPGFLAWQSGTLAGHGNYTVEMSWIPDASCWEINDVCAPNEHRIRSVVLSDLINPKLLSYTSLEGITVIDTTDHGNRLYKLSIDGKEYDIEYSIDSGYIRSVELDRDSTMLSFHVSDVNIGSLLTVKAPKDLLFEAFSCGTEPAPGEMERSVEVFVDTVPVAESFDLADDEWKLMIEAGATRVEFVGTCVG